MNYQWTGRLTAVAAGIAIALTAAGAPTQARATDPAPVFTPGKSAGVERYLVVVAPGSARAVAGLEQAAIASGGRLTHRYSRVLNGFAAELPAKALAAVRANPAVAYIERDSVITGNTVQPNPPSWGIDRIDQRNLPWDNSYTYNSTGAGVTAFMVDSGIRTTHTEFGGRATFGANFVADGRTDDCHGHGTHTSGTVGGATYGVAKEVKLVAVRVLTCDNTGSTTDLVAAMDWVAKNHPARSVANFSLQGYGTASNDAAEGLLDSGVQTVFIANNFNGDACLNAPRSPRGVVVGAIDGTDAKASFSSFGPCVDIFAPGVGISSSINTDDTAWGSWSGTSMAAPHVTGWIARYLQEHPSATMADSKAALIASSTKDVLTGLGDGSPNRLLFADPGTGGGDTEAPTAPGAPVASNLTSSGVTLRWTAAMDNVGVTGYDLYDGNDLVVGSYTGTNATLSGLTPGTSYTYYVRSRDAAGNISARSGTVTVTTPGDVSEWSAGVYYAAGSKVSYGGLTYECRQPHTSQAGWEPPNVPALWQRI